MATHDDFPGHDIDQRLLFQRTELFDPITGAIDYGSIPEEDQARVMMDSLSRAQDNLAKAETAIPFDAAKYAMELGVVHYLTNIMMTEFTDPRIRALAQNANIALHDSGADMVMPAPRASVIGQDLEKSQS